jgi:hypothetical protein
MLTKEAADKFSGLAQRLPSRGHAPEAVAHFVMQRVFCFFAEDVRLLPDGFFRKELNIGNRYRQAKSLVDEIFRAMAEGGRVGSEFVVHFNGGLFNGQMALPLDEGDLGLLVAVGSMQWAEIDHVDLRHPVRALPRSGQARPDRRALHDAKKILQIVDPVVMRPLEAEWAELSPRIEKLRRREPKGAARQGMGAGQGSPRAGFSDMVCFWFAKAMWTTATLSCLTSRNVTVLGLQPSLHEPDDLHRPLNMLPEGAILCKYE